jgi:hypothetical protein
VVQINVWIKLTIWLFIVYMAFQYGRYMGYGEGFGDAKISLENSIIRVQQAD